LSGSWLALQPDDPKLSVASAAMKPVVRRRLGARSRRSTGFVQIIVSTDRIFVEECKWWREGVSSIGAPLGRAAFMVELKVAETISVSDYRVRFV
jgi:hypothetical protein